MSPSRPFILRPVATALLMAAILLAGIVAYMQLPVSALPQVDYPTIQVLTFYPGASPNVMATTVTAPLERQFGQLQGLSQMTSTSSGGCSVIVMQFSLSLEHRRGRRGGAVGNQCGAELPAVQPAGTAGVQQDESGGRTGSHAGDHLGLDAVAAGGRSGGYAGWRRSFRNSTAWDWSASAADRSRRCEFRPTPPHCPPMVSTSKTCAPR